MFKVTPLLVVKAGVLGQVCFCFSINTSGNPWSPRYPSSTKISNASNLCVVTECIWSNVACSLYSLKGFIYHKCESLPVSLLSLLQLCSPVLQQLQSGVICQRLCYRRDREVIPSHYRVGQRYWWNQALRKRVTHEITEGVLLICNTGNIFLYGLTLT